MADQMPPPARPDQFKGRVVIVSGAGGKLGRVICKALCDSGADVVVNDINADAVAQLLVSLEKAGGAALGIPGSATGGHEIVEKTIQWFSTVHAVINAILGPVAWTKFEETTDETFRNAFESNVLGPFSIARAAWPYFKAQNFGRIVNFTSDSVNKTLAMEGAAHNIKVNCVSPIAFVPHMERHIVNFPETVQEAFRTRYKPEGNISMILALVSEECQASGEVFTTSGWAVGRAVMGYVEGENEMRTVDDCLAKVGGVCEKGTRDVFEPNSQVDFTEWQGKYVLAKR